MGQGWFETDDDYQSRMSREANEQRIQSAAGDAPKQGWFESDGDYDARISREADEATISSYSGDVPRQGWFESESDYRHRVADEAREAVIQHYDGESAKQGWFEDDDDYRHRLRHEANEATVRGLSGDDAKQGWFESDVDYRRRVSLEAREHLARGRQDGGGSGSSGSPSGSGFGSGSGSYGSGGGESSGAGIGTLILLFIGAVFLLGGPRDLWRIATSRPGCESSASYANCPGRNAAPTVADKTLPLAQPAVAAPAGPSAEENKQTVRGLEESLSQVERGIENRLPDADRVDFGLMRSNWFVNQIMIGCANEPACSIPKYRARIAELEAVHDPAFKRPEGIIVEGGGATPAPAIEPVAAKSDDGRTGRGFETDSSRSDSGDPPPETAAPAAQKCVLFNDHYIC